MGERLEHVRETVAQIPTLTEFYARLAEGVDPAARFPTYHAARNYHLRIDGREAPAAYLARVAEVFGIRWRWLVWGEEPIVEPRGGVPAEATGAATQDTLEGVRAALEAAFPGMGNARVDAFPLLLDVVLRAGENIPPDLSTANTPQAHRIEAATTIGQLMREPLIVFGRTELEQIPGALDIYILSFAQALLAILPAGGLLAKLFIGQPKYGRISAAEHSRSE